MLFVFVFKTKSEGLCCCFCVLESRSESLVEFKKLKSWKNFMFEVANCEVCEVEFRVSRYLLVVQCCTAQQVHVVCCMW